ncbi:hypothetical protein NC652_011420 [Populus alba x Populus x berolinensis]|nr:hypothetical protein NC652_011420 [Populus alba x Populus x berolinensis]
MISLLMDNQSSRGSLLQKVLIKSLWLSFEILHYRINRMRPNCFFLQFQISRMAKFHRFAALLEVSLSQLVIFHGRFIVFVMPVYLVVLS